MEQPNKTQGLTETIQYLTYVVHPQLKLQQQQVVGELEFVVVHQVIMELLVDQEVEQWKMDQRDLVTHLQQLLLKVITEEHQHNFLVKVVEVVVLVEQVVTQGLMVEVYLEEMVVQV